jgi:membrane-bound metal-dependent hydrolase YbcI (DUF457 family)
VPFTPFHLGPGAVAKAIGGRHFSFMVYGGSQVLMDIEPLIGLIRGSHVLHGYTHTILGALIIGFGAAILGKPISALVLKVARIPHHPLTWTASFLGAFFGTYSHIVLDAVMHHDIRPWWPIASGNGLLGIVSLSSLHIACVLASIVGAGAVAVAVAFGKHGKT